MTTVTANNVLEGQLIGDWLVKPVDGKPCNVVELQGTVGRAWRSTVRKALLKPSLKRQTSKLSALSPATLPAVRERSHGELYQSGKQRQEHLHGLRP
jgi:hypothetical protein